MSNMTFSLTYYLKVRAAISIYCISRIIPKKIDLVHGHYRTLKTLLGKKVKNHMNSRNI